MWPGLPRDGRWLPRLRHGSAELAYQVRRFSEGRDAGAVDEDCRGAGASNPTIAARAGGSGQAGDSDLRLLLLSSHVFVASVQRAAGAVRAKILRHLTATLNMQWTSRSFAHLLRLPMPGYEKRHLGDIVPRFGSISALLQALTG